MTRTLTLHPTSGITFRIKDLARRTNTTPVSPRPIRIVFFSSLNVPLYDFRSDHPSPPTPQDKMTKEEIIRSLQAAESYWEKGSYVTGDSTEPKQQQQQRLSRSTQRRSNDLSASPSSRKDPPSSKEASPLNSSPTAPPSSSSALAAAATSNGNAPVHPSSKSPFVVESMSEDKVMIFSLNWWRCPHRFCEYLVISTSTFSPFCCLGNGPFR